MPTARTCALHADAADLSGEVAAGVRFYTEGAGVRAPRIELAAHADVGVAAGGQDAYRIAGVRIDVHLAAHRDVDGKAFGVDAGRPFPLHTNLAADRDGVGRPAARVAVDAGRVAEDAGRDRIVHHRHQGVAGRMEVDRRRVAIHAEGSGRAADVRVGVADDLYRDRVPACGADLHVAVDLRDRLAVGLDIHTVGLGRAHSEDAAVHIGQDRRSGPVESGGVFENRAGGEVAVDHRFGKAARHDVHGGRADFALGRDPPARVQQVGAAGAKDLHTGGVGVKRLGIGAAGLHIGRAARRYGSAVRRAEQQPRLGPAPSHRRRSPPTPRQRPCPSYRWSGRRRRRPRRRKRHRRRNWWFLRPRRIRPTPGRCPRRSPRRRRRPCRSQTRLRWIPPKPWHRRHRRRRLAPRHRRNRLARRSRSRPPRLPRPRRTR